MVLGEQLHTPIFTSFASNQTPRMVEPTRKITSTQSYVPRGRIYVSGDSDLQSHFPIGAGTIDDPVLIENYSITPTLNEPLIYISGVTLHFRIANNLLNGSNDASFGIRFINVENGTIKNNTVTNAQEYGISLISSPNNIITMNTVYNNSEHGIGLSSSDNCTIFENIAYKNTWNGISCSQSTNVTISNNTVYENDFQGISTHYVDHSTITNNTAYANEVDGIALYFSDYNEITNNAAWDNEAKGIRLENTTDYNNILYNTFFSNGEGIWIGNSCENNTISHNEVKNNNANGIALTTDSGVGFNINNTISRNIVSNNQYQGIMLDADSDDNIISYNLIFRNNLAGISTGPASESNEIHYNDFSGNNPGGPQADDQGINNVFANNYWSDWDGTGSYSFGGNDDSSPLTNPYHLTPPSITAPTSATTTLKDNVTIEWTSSTDSFGHTITYTIFYSDDDGTSWDLIVSELTSTSYTWNLSSIDNGTQVLLKVRAIDSVGFKSYSISTSKFTIETTPTTTKGTAGWNILLLILSLIVLVPLSYRTRKD